MRLPWLFGMLLLVLTGCAAQPLLVEEEPEGIGGTGISSYQLVQGPDGIGGTGIIGPVNGYSRNESQPDNILLEVNNLVVAVNLSATVHNQDPLNFSLAPGQVIALALPASTADPVHLALLHTAGANPLTELARLGARPMHLNISGVLQKTGDAYRIDGMDVSVTRRMKQKLDASGSGPLRVHAGAGITRHGKVRLRRILTVKPVDIPARKIPRPAPGGTLDKPEPVRTQTPVHSSSGTDKPEVPERPEVVRPQVRPVAPPTVIPTPRIEPPTRPEPQQRPPDIETPPVIGRPQPIRIEPIAIDGADRIGIKN